MVKTAQVTAPAEELTTKVPKSTSKQIDTILATPDGLQYLNMCEVTGQTTKQQLYDSPVKATDWSAAYYRWIEAEKPQARMPETPQGEAIAILQGLVRLKHRDKEYLIVENTNGTKEGVTYKPIYAKEDHPITGVPMKMDVIVGKDITYFLEFDADETRARMEHATKLLEVGHQFNCYIQLTDKMHSVTHKNFLRPWDELIQDIAHKKVLHV